MKWRSALFGIYSPSFAGWYRHGGAEIVLGQRNSWSALSSMTQHLSRGLWTRDQASTIHQFAVPRKSYGAATSLKGSPNA